MEIDTEVFTPIERGNKTRAARWIAFVMDDLIPIPGTKRRVGLDPILGLLPGAGDFFASTAGLVVLVAGARRRIKTSVFTRMAGNWLLNTLLGLIPLVGDVFSFWFKSNRRNYELMRAAIDSQDGEPGEGTWWPVLVLVGVALLAFAVIGSFVAWLVWLVFH